MTALRSLVSHHLLWGLAVLTCSWGIDWVSPERLWAQTTAALSSDGGAERANAEGAKAEVDQHSGSLDATMPGVRRRIVRFTGDQDLLRRQLGPGMGDARFQAWQLFYQRWLASLTELDFFALPQDERIDYLLFRNHLEGKLRELAYRQSRDAELQELLPFAPIVDGLELRRREMQPVDAQAAAGQLDQLTQKLNELMGKLERSELLASSAVAYRALDRLSDLRRELDDWYRFYDSYDPVFTWWSKRPYEQTTERWDRYQQLVRDKLIQGRAGSDDPVVGDPIGREALLAALREEMIPYSPEELVEIANQEFAWCEREYRHAAADMGLQDDWQAALERVKQKHVGPGEQPQLIRQLADEAVKFLEQRELVTIPEFCKHSWRMEMMTPERQRVNPYFTGGEVISISYPTATMEHADKLMSMRGNNIHFSRATVHHELIPGHHLQLYMADRHRSYRQIFNTPFYVEGWALHWEMLLWDLGFPQSPEDRIGMLFWRSHRCARIIFSLQYHLGKMSADECIDFLVDRVGHERRNATAEVRRSVEGSYSPLYQAAYMLGGLQLRSLHRQLVERGPMTHRAFHDAVLRENSIPIEMVRASLLQLELTPDYSPNWRFYEGGTVEPKAPDPMAK